ncbi:hypothetical protein BDN72DRAFT_845308, partial [Pluteus cervinus]
VIHDSLKNHLQDMIWKPGVCRLYQGIEVQTLKGFINQGVTLLVKGRCVRLRVFIKPLPTRQYRIEQPAVRAYLDSLRKTLV